MHTVFALLCFVVVIHWLIFPYPSGLLHWHCGNLTIAPVPAKQPWWIWINTSCEFIMNDYITTTKQSTTKPGAYLLGYTVAHCRMELFSVPSSIYCMNAAASFLFLGINETNTRLLSDKNDNIEDLQEENKRITVPMRDNLERHVCCCCENSPDGVCIHDASRHVGDLNGNRMRTTIGDRLNSWSRSCTIPWHRMWMSSHFVVVYCNLSAKWNV